MNLVMYVFKRNFDVQKAERFFKERKLSYQVMDMKKRAPGMKELLQNKIKVGMNNLIDRENKAYLEHPMRFMRGEQAILEALMAAPQLLKSPIVRDGQRVTVGYEPDIWLKWSES